ncbi:MAG: preprotein translocase subunit SecE [Thermoanaerobaculaceae bacterium]
MKWWEQLKSFLREVSAEIKKVSWPSRDETLATTVVVIAASFIFGVFLYLCDLAFFAAVRWVVKILS